MMEIKSFKDLIVWQKGMLLVKMAYALTEKFPDKEKFGLTSQIRRSAVSIPANISEGWGRKSTKSYIQFLNIAVGSLYEIQTHMLISKELNYITDEECLEFEKLADEESRMMYSLINTLEKKINDKSIAAQAL